MAVVLEDLVELGVVEPAALADQCADTVEEHEVEPTVLVVECRVAGRTVGIGETLPGGDVGLERLEREGAGAVEEDLGVIGELTAAARVGRRPAERVGLGDADRTGVQVLDDGGHLGDECRETAAGGDLVLRPAELAAQEPAGGEMTVGPEATVAVERSDEDGGLGFEASHREFDLGEPTDPLRVGEGVDRADQFVDGARSHAGRVSNIRTSGNVIGMTCSTDRAVCGRWARADGRVGSESRGGARHRFPAVATCVRRCTRGRRPAPRCACVPTSARSQAPSVSGVGTRGWR